MSPEIVTVYLLLGTNLGDRLSLLEAARQEISKKIGPILSQSSVYETEPWGVSAQPLYFNQALAVATMMTPAELLKKTASIEKELGRIRRRNGESRTMDIDILYYNGNIVHQNALEIPHPRLHLRNFALVPLTEIAPDFVHPRFNKTNQELLLGSPDRLQVNKI